MLTPNIAAKQTTRLAFTATGLIALLIAAACGSLDSSPTPVQSDVQTGSAPNWKVIGDEIDIVLATPDLGVGNQRFAAVLSDSQGLVKFPVIEFSSYRYSGGFAETREGPVQTTLSRFSLFPLGTRGIHVTEFDFDRPGAWSVEVTVPRTDGTSAVSEVRFQVQDEPRSVSVGEPAPRSRNRTLADVDDIGDLTTGSFHDEELYRNTIEEVIEDGRPFVVVFASPAFCTNAVCGPQVEVVSELREQYADKAAFIHVDLFENPREIQGDLSRAVETELLSEWGLISQEWTYVVDPNGSVAARFENFVGKEELADAIESVIGSDQSG